MNKLQALATLVYDHLGDPRTKNVLIVVLTLMSAFGVIAPATATSLRDMVLGLVFNAS